LAEAEMGIGVVSPYATAIMADRVHASSLMPAVPVKAFLLFPRNRVKSALAVASARWQRDISQPQIAA